MLHYWNMYTHQIPKLWVGDTLEDGTVVKRDLSSRIIRVIGHQHDWRSLRWIYQIAEQNPKHRFLVFGTDMTSFQEVFFPFNVTPVLQVDSRKAYSANIDSYLDLCKECRVETPTISVFCNQVIEMSKNVKWLFLSGTQLATISSNIHANTIKRRDKIPIYVEKLQYSGRLPDNIYIRQLANGVESDLSSCSEYFEEINSLAI